MRVFLFVAICVVLTASMTSCFDQGDCIFTNSNVVGITLVNKDTTSKVKAVLMDSILVLSKVGIIYKPDTVLAASAYAVSIDPNDTRTELVFYWENHVDHLVLTYTSQSQVLGLDCGTYQFINDLTVEATTFDSVNIVNPKLRIDFKTKTPVPNVQVFL